MEDAMILNKSSYERGFGHGVVYKSYNKEINEGQDGRGERMSAMATIKKKEGPRYRMFNQHKNK